MKKKVFSVFIIICATLTLSAQNIIYEKKESLSAVKKHEAKQAFEAESLFPMFFSGGYHFAVGYRYGKFRLRMSVINGGSYDAEKAGINNSAYNFKSYYKTTPSFFLGYNL